MNKKYLNVSIFFWLSFIVVSASFILFPQIDIYVSNLFYDGKSFWLKGYWLEQLLYHSIKPLLITLFLSVSILYLFNLFKKRTFLNINFKFFIYVILILTVAPGLIVNLILKENWGRARPTEIIIYGGNLEFTPAFVPTNQGGYSFSSGHSAAAFSLIGFALLARKRKKEWMTVAITYGILMSIARVSVGGHFFSDVVSSFFIVYIFSHIIYMFIFKEKK